MKTQEQKNNEAFGEIMKDKFTTVVVEPNGIHLLIKNLMSGGYGKKFFKNYMTGAEYFIPLTEGKQKEQLRTLIGLNN